MSESRRSRRRAGFLLSRGYTVMLKRKLLERATRKGIPWKGKVMFERMSLTNSANKRKRKVTRSMERRAGAKRARRALSALTRKHVEGMDYISELPDCVIHNILSFLHAREVARMSILSKRWRQVWCSFPQLDIDHRYFRQYGDDWVVKLINHVDTVLQNCAFQRINIDKFRLSVTNNALMTNLMKTWIEGAMERNVKELHIHFRQIHFVIDPDSFQTCIFSATTLTVLSLYGCNLKTSNNIKLPLLQKLSLRNVGVSDQMLQNLICSCPLIEELRLVGCRELENVNVSGPTKLERFHLYQCEDLVSIKISAPMLRSIWLQQRSNWQGVDPHINLKGCVNLRELVMECPSLFIGDFLELPVMGPGSSLFNYKVPLLEKLVIRKGMVGSFLGISGENLTKLAVIDCPEVIQLQICAPQLIGLEYKGHDIPITLLGPTKIREVKLTVKGTADDDTKECKYHELLRTLSKCGSLKLLIEDMSEVTIQEDLSRIFPPLTMGYSVRTIKISASIDCLIESILTNRKYPSRFSLFSHEGSKLHEAIYDKLNDGRKDLNCCSYFKSKCWKHHLRKVTSKRSTAEWSEEIDDLEGNSDWLKTSFLLRWETDKTKQIG